mgnify:FL=1|tara:strand:+ start:164 stop:394 length:231 start_codon:yes stop_codon:yes gene_type:complete
MSLKFLAQLSHFITMMFGIAFGMAICILYQFKVGIFIDRLSPVVVFIIIVSGLLRGYTLFIWKSKDLESKIFDQSL